MTFPNQTRKCKNVFGALRSNLNLDSLPDIDGNLAHLHRFLSGEERALLRRLIEEQKEAESTAARLKNSFHWERRRLSESLGVVNILTHSSRYAVTPHINGEDPAFFSHGHPNSQGWPPTVSPIISSPFDLNPHFSGLGLMASFHNPEGAFMEEGKRLNWITVPRLRRAILVRHQRVAQPLLRLGLYPARNRIYRGFERLFYFYCENFWFFMDRYHPIRFFLYDLNITLSLFVFSYLFFGYISFYPYFVYFYPDMPYADYLSWRLGWAIESNVGTPLSLFFLCYPTYGFPFLLLIFCGPRPNPGPLYRYRGYLPLILFTVNFFSAVVVCAYGLPNSPENFSVLCRHDRCYYILDYSLLFLYQLHSQFMI